MRSAREIRFRLWQQAQNLGILVFAPALKAKAIVSALPLPDPETVAISLRGTQYSADVERIADEILARRVPLFGLTVDTGPEIQWRKDYTSGQVSAPAYFRFIPYLDFAKAGDHKMVWELNRHQHLVLLAQAWLLTRRPAYLVELQTQIESWFEQNAYLRGINFASALEVAFRALSWLWVDHLVGKALRPELRRQILNGLFQHGHFLEANLSTYFSPNTHLLGEGVALHALGLKFPETNWEKVGNRIVTEELRRQIQPDGSHFEQSTYYHVYALDFFVFYFTLSGRPALFEEPIRRMARFLSAIQGPTGLLAFFGDDDGGRLFHPFGDRAAFGRASLATCARLFPGERFPVDPASAAEQSSWWLGPSEATAVAPSDTDTAALFENSGLLAISRGTLQILVDSGPFGPGGAGHSHSDTLSFTIRSGNRELLIDPGTFTYVADAQARDAFRGSGYHNTVRVNGLDQADPTRPFRWDNKPAVVRSEFRDDAETVYLDATCKYRGIAHRRRFFLVGSRALFVLDSLTGPEGEHEIEQFWHLGPEAEKSLTIVSDAPATPELTEGWRSCVLGSKEPVPVVVYRWRQRLPAQAVTAFVFNQPGQEWKLHVDNTAGVNRLTVPNLTSVELPASGPGRILAP